jgi:hypothetical protein
MQQMVGLICLSPKGMASGQYATPTKPAIWMSIESMHGNLMRWEVIWRDIDFYDDSIINPNEILSSCFSSMILFLTSEKPKLKNIQNNLSLRNYMSICNAITSSWHQPHDSIPFVSIKFNELLFYRSHKYIILYFCIRIWYSFDQSILRWQYWEGCKSFSLSAHGDTRHKNWVGFSNRNLKNIPIHNNPMSPGANINGTQLSLMTLQCAKDAYRHQEHWLR